MVMLAARSTSEKKVWKCCNQSNCRDEGRVVYSVRVLSHTHTHAHTHTQKNTYRHTHKHKHKHTHTHTHTLPHSPPHLHTHPIWEGIQLRNVGNGHWVECQRDVLQLNTAVGKLSGTDRAHTFTIVQPTCTGHSMREGVVRTIDSHECQHRACSAVPSAPLLEGTFDGVE